MVTSGGEEVCTPNQSDVKNGLALKHLIEAADGTKVVQQRLAFEDKDIGDDEQQWWETPFEIWWNFCIKFWCPFAIYMLLMYAFKNDTENMYGGYHIFSQVMGFLYPIGGFISFIIPLISRRRRWRSARTSRCRVTRTPARFVRWPPRCLRSKPLKIIFSVR